MSEEKNNFNNSYTKFMNKLNLHPNLKQKILDPVLSCLWAINQERAAEQITASQAIRKKIATIQEAERFLDDHIEVDCSTKQTP